MRALLNLLSKPPKGDDTVALEVNSPAATAPTCGLVMIEVRTASEQERPAVLKVSVAGHKPFTKSVQLGATHDSWIALHGQLLPNGPVTVKFELTSAAGDHLASKSVTVQVWNEGELAKQVARALKATGVPLVVDGVCDSSIYDFSDTSLAAWFDRSPEHAEQHIQSLERSGKANAEEAAALRHFVERGFIIMPDVVDEEHRARLNAALDDAAEKHIEGYEWGSSQRIHNLHTQYDAIHELWVHPKILRMLSLVFGARAMPCQSLSYIFGSEQQYHQDTIHLTPYPAGRMCGVWTALEDVKPGSGELVVFPGSHRERRVYMPEIAVPKVKGDDWSEFGTRVEAIWTEMLKRGQYPREIYRPKAGTVLIWHENLMHAGSVRTERELSRRSIVGHYFAHGAVVYHDSTGMPAVLQDR